MNQEKSKETVNEIKDRGIYVLGSGCSKCNTLEDNVKQALNSLGIEEELGHIRDFSIIASLGVLATPALVVDGKVVSSGKVLNKDQCMEIIARVRG